MALTLPRLRRRARRWTLITAGVAVLAVAALVLYFTVLRPRSAAAEATLPEAVTAEVTTETFEQTVDTSGTLTPTVRESVSFQASGTVTSVAVAEGDTVTEGQVLATIDTLRLDAALASANAALASAKADLADAREANDGTDAAVAKVAAKQSAVAVAQSEYDAASAAMSGATLVAPAAGLVTSVDVSVGDAVTGGESDGSSGGPTGGSATSNSMTNSTTNGQTSEATGAAFTIVGTSSWSVDVTVGESDIARIAVGDQVEMTADDLGEIVFGTVATIGLLPGTDSGTVAYPVSIAVTGTPEGLRDGLSVDVSIVDERRTDVLAVPSAAVTTADGTSTVQVVTEDGTTTERTIEVGERSGTWVEVVSGLTEGETVSYTPFVGTGGDGGQSGQFPAGEFPGQLPGGDEIVPGQLPGGGEFAPGDLPVTRGGSS